MASKSSVARYWRVAAAIVTLLVVSSIIIAGVELVDDTEQPDVSTGGSDSNTGVEVVNRSSANTSTGSSNNTRIVARNVSANTRLTTQIPPTQVSSESGVRIDQISVTLSREVPDVNITVSQSGKVPGEVGLLNVSNASSAMLYLNVTHPMINEEDISGATIKFSIEKETIRKQGVSPGNISLLRYSERSWSMINTELVGETDSSYRFRARSPGLSVFSVVVNPFSSLSRETESETINQPGEKSSTKTVLNLPPKIKNGVVTFTGQLIDKYTDTGIAGKKIYIYDKDGGLGSRDDQYNPLDTEDNLLATGTTNENGQFVIRWEAEQIGSSADVEVYAAFEGSSLYEPSRSPQNQEYLIQTDSKIRAFDFGIDIVPTADTVTTGTSTRYYVYVWSKDGFEADPQMDIPEVGLQISGLPEDAYELKPRSEQPSAPTLFVLGGGKVPASVSILEIDSSKLSKGTHRFRVAGEWHTIQKLTTEQSVRVVDRSEIGAKYVSYNTYSTTINPYWWRETATVAGIETGIADPARYLIDTTTSLIDGFSTPGRTALEELVNGFAETFIPALKSLRRFSVSTILAESANQAGVGIGQIQQNLQQIPELMQRGDYAKAESKISSTLDKVRVWRDTLKTMEIEEGVPRATALAILNSLESFLEVELESIQTRSGRVDPEAAIDYSPPNPALEEPVSFDASGSTDPDGSIAEYEWDFDDDGDFEVNGASITHSFSEPGQHKVTLRVTDESGSQDTQQVLVFAQQSESSRRPSEIDIDFGCTYVAIDASEYDRVTLEMSDGTSREFTGDYSGFRVFAQYGDVFGDSKWASTFDEFHGKIEYVEVADGQTVKTFESDVEGCIVDYEFNCSAITLTGEDQDEVELSKVNLRLADGTTETQTDISFSGTQTFTASENVVESAYIEWTADESKQYEWLEPSNPEATTCEVPSKPGNNSVVEEATPIDLPTEADGQLSEEGAEDWYSFEAEKGEAIKIEVSSTVSPNITLYGPDDNVIYSPNASANTIATGAIAEKTGTYYIRLAGTSSAPDDYHLLVDTAEPDSFEPNEDRDSAVRIEPGEVGGIVAEGDEDWFAIEATAGERINTTVELGDDGFAAIGEDLQVDLYTSDGSQIGEITAEEPTSGPVNRTFYQPQVPTATQTAIAEETGIYYVRVSGAYDIGGFSRYTLTASTTPANSNNGSGETGSGTDLQSISYGETRRGEVDKDDPTYGIGGSEERSDGTVVSWDGEAFYEPVNFTGQAGDTVLVTVRSVAGNSTGLYLRAPNGSTMTRENFEHGVGVRADESNTRIKYELGSSGTYTIGVATFGLYELSLEANKSKTTTTEISTTSETQPPSTVDPSAEATTTETETTTTTERPIPNPPTTTEQPVTIPPSTTTTNTTTTTETETTTTTTTTTETETPTDEPTTTTPRGSPTPTDEPTDTPTEEETTSEIPDDEDDSEDEDDSGSSSARLVLLAVIGAWVTH